MVEKAGEQMEKLSFDDIIKGKDVSCLHYTYHLYGKVIELSVI